MIISNLKPTIKSISEQLCDAVPGLIQGMIYDEAHKLILERILKLDAEVLFERERAKTLIKVLHQISELIDNQYGFDKLADAALKEYENMKVSI